MMNPQSGERVLGGGRGVGGITKGGGRRGGRRGDVRGGRNRRRGTKN